MEFKGSKTEKNLEEAFAGESMARNKYTYYASKARKDGYEEVGNIFEETAGNEKEHAKIWFKLIHGGAVPETTLNLIDAAAGEHGEWTDMYARMSKEAKEEGFIDISNKLAGVARIEKMHEERFLDLAKKIKEETMFKNEKVISWFCLNCGNVEYGKDAPEKCSVCDHPKSYFIPFKGLDNK
ncbi:MAG: rubrerythrin family protein [Clostridia bacterium]|nr:rubrerythrin family protein [Clostridia bacterium]